MALIETVRAPHSARIDSTTRSLVLVLALGLFASGLWAGLAPDSFYTFVATYPPYNRHLVHDLGAFLIGLGASLGLALAIRDGLLVALAANTVAGTAHFVSHVVDRELGGQPSDPVTIGVLALVLVALTLWRTRVLEQARRNGPNTHGVSRGV